MSSAAVSPAPATPTGEPASSPSPSTKRATTVPSSAARWTFAHAYDPMAQPNPCAHVQAAKVVPLQFDAPRKPVRFEDGWDLYRRMGEPKHVCAPMVNQSELAFRLLCRRYGTHLAVTPMFHAEIFGKDPKYRADAMPPIPAADRPLAVQFCGNNPQHMLRAAKLVEHEADSVDINIGCPQNIAKRGNYGAFLLTQTQLLHDMVSTLHQNLSIPVTCKIRRLPAVPATATSPGMTGDEATIALVKMLEEAGAAFITVHGRSRLQLKDKVGQCDFDLIRLVKQNARVPVFANGGIAEMADVEACLRYTGVDGVMSSEALLCNPTLFSGQERKDSLLVAQEYLDIVQQLKNDGVTDTDQSMIRAHLFKILYQQLGVHSDLRDRLGLCTPEQFQPLVTELTLRFANQTPEQTAEQLAQVPLWYHRHVPTAAQEAAAEAKRLEKERLSREREQEELDGLCEGFSCFDEDL